MLQLAGVLKASCHTMTLATTEQSHLQLGNAMQGIIIIIMLPIKP
jgi:hypothetical protein